MSDNVTVVGLQELGAQIDKLFRDTAKKAIKKASNAGTEVFRREIRAKAPVRQDEYPKGSKQRKPGYLKKHIGRWSKQNSDGSLSTFTGPTKSAFYGKFYEFGTSHQSANPFMRPVFDSRQGEAERVFAETLEAEIKKELP
jgi:HK97 gp10 family phage protein